MRDYQFSYKNYADSFRNQHTIVVIILNDMVFDNGDWEDGKIMEDKKGKTYDCKLWVEDGNLQVRVYIAFFFHTQEWLRYDGEI